MPSKKVSHEKVTQNRTRTNSFLYHRRSETHYQLGSGCGSDAAFQPTMSIDDEERRDRRGRGRGLID